MGESGRHNDSVMAGLVPAIHGCLRPIGKTWMPGTGMTQNMWKRLQ
jgi:hypothetical protein